MYGTVGFAVQKSRNRATHGCNIGVRRHCVAMPFLNDIHNWPIQSRHIDGHLSLFVASRLKLQARLPNPPPVALWVDRRFSPSRPTGRLPPPQCFGSPRLRASAPPASVLRLTPMSTQDTDEVGAEGPAGPKITLSWNRPVVTGGLSKKPWAPTLLLDDTGEPLSSNNNYFFPLSSNDYDLGLCLFGKVNSEGSRNFNKSVIVRSLWKARIAMQDDLLAQMAASQEKDTAQDTVVLSDIFDEDPVPRAAAPRPKLKQGGPRKEEQLKLLPRFLTLTVASSQPGKDVVTFKVPRAMDSCLPAIELCEDVLQQLFDEVRAETRHGDRFVGEDGWVPPAPSTPQRGRGGRRKSGLVLSPGSSPKAVKKKDQCVQTHHDKKAGRIVAKWRKSDGSVGQKAFPLRNPNNKEEIEEITEVARCHAVCNHFAAARQTRRRRPRSGA